LSEKTLEYELTPSSMDRNELFLNPVNRFEVPDYFQVIKEPMSWMQMDDKLEKTLYRTTEDFKVSPASP
jgi:NuA3 HAT complex component NTO1